MAWSRVLGHDHLIERFDDIVRRGRLAHAYLFVGQQGIGKTLFARELAKALLCEQAAADEAAPRLGACDRCAACLLFDADTHPDFFSVSRGDDSLELKIDLMRELRDRFGLKPARGKGKVAVIEDADDMNDEAANCFLKTLEEPPPRSTLILIGSSTDRQLSTILSRCHVVRFAPLAGDVVDRVLASQGVADKDERQRLVRAGGGSPGRALALADRSLWDVRRRFVETMARPRGDVVGLSRALIELVEEAGKEAAAQRQRAKLVLGLFLDAVSTALRLAQGGAAKADPVELAILGALADRAGAERLLDIFERILAAETQIDFYIQVALVLEGMVEACARILEENPTAAPISAGK